MYELSFFTYVAAVSAFGLATLCHVSYAMARGCLWLIWSVLFAGHDYSVIVVDRGEVPRPVTYATLLAASGAALLGAALVLRALAIGSGPFASLREFGPAFALGTALVYLVLEWRYRVRHLGLAVLPIILALLTYVSIIPAEAWPLVSAWTSDLPPGGPLAVAVAAAVVVAIPLGAGLFSLARHRGTTDRAPATDGSGG